MLRKKKGVKTLVLVSDSVCWKASVTGESQKKLVTVESINVVPEALIEWGASLGAKAVKFLLPSDISLIEMSDLDDDLDKHEIHDVIVWESAEREGYEAEEVQLSAVKADLLKLGTAAKSWIVSHFKKSLISIYREACGKQGLEFAGIGSLQQLALTYLTSQSEFSGTAFAELDASSGFVAAPARKGKEAIVRQLSSGLPPEDKVLHDAWGQRLARRMNAVKDFPVTMLTLNSNLTEIKEHVGEYLPNLQVNLLSIDDYIEKFVYMVESAKVFDMQAVSLADLPPKEKDPRTTATYIGLTMFALVFLALGANWWNLNSSLAVYQKRIDLKSELEKARTSASSKVSSLDKQKASLRAQYSFLQNDIHFDESLKIVLNYVSTELPEYSRLESISYDTKGMKLKMVTLWQKEINVFIGELNKKLQQKQLLIVPGNISKEGRAFFYTVDILKK